MKAIYFTHLFLFIFTFQFTFAQPGFNLIKDINLPTNHFRDMIVDNDTLIGYGLAYDTISQLQGLLLAKYDSSGNFITSKLILDSLGDYLSISKHWGKIIKTSDGGYAMTAATVYRKSAFLIKLSHDLKMEFIKEYPDTVNLANYRYTPVEIQNGYLLYGAIQRPNFLDDAFIRRVDKQGNTIWFKYYGVYNQDDAIVDLRMVNDSIAVAASVDGLNGSPTGSSRSTIRFINLDGAVVQSWYSGPEPEIGYLRKAIPLEDGGLLTYGVYVVYVTQFGTKVVQSTLARFTPGMQIEWVKHYGLLRSLDAGVLLLDIEPTHDGNFIGAGQSTIVLPNDVGLISGWLFKFSPQGDSIWSRYDMGPYPPNYVNSHFFGGVGVLSSGNIIAGGSAEEGQKKYIWLVKVTTDGCLDTIFCGLVNAAEEVLPEQEGMEVRVYPNPASDYLNIQYRTQQPLRRATFRIFDAMGRVVKEFLSDYPKDTVILPVWDWPQGVYFLEASAEGKVLATSRFLKN